MKIEQFYNKNQFLIYNKGEYYLQSYESTVAKIDSDHNLILGSDWDYSNTTRKHLYLFINDYIELIKPCQRELLKELNSKQNKRKYIESLINNNIIKCVCGDVE